MGFSLAGGTNENQLLLRCIEYKKKVITEPQKSQQNKNEIITLTSNKQHPPGEVGEPVATGGKWKLPRVASNFIAA